jgi:hypothetical protein
MDTVGSVALPTEIENTKIVTMRDFTAGNDLTKQG